METIKRLFRKYVVDALSYMALGLFCSLILGLIVGQLAKIEFLGFLGFIAEALSASSPLVGACIGFAIVLGLKYAPLVTISSAIVGALGYKFGGPVGSYFAVIVAARVGELVSKKTPVDIILTPLVTIVVGGMIARFCCSPINDFMLYLGSLINNATALSPFLMGVVVSVLVGCALTLPISSAALCIMLGIDGLAAGAATVGCCAQMVGFAVISFKDNGVGGLLSQGLGTSMLQIGNIVRKPIIWLAPTLTAAILGPISTVVFGMTNNALGAGMGTSGLVGPIATYADMTAAGGDPTAIIIKIAVLHFVAPAIISLLIHFAMTRLGWVKKGDMKIG
ncbi:MAG: PTS sugar transporter subunit IIC [Bacteroidales bacterium]|nr:PTS sugar transporter subunit IIC [Bacteroidales bacterium]MBO7764205.1 PTS sugar transporter subunit IIC [Bacteroidales bacterium]